MRRGEVWIGNLNPTRGREIGKVRPVVILQCNTLTEQGIGTVVALPLTTQLRPGSEALRVCVPARDRLLQTCYVVAEQPRAVDRNRFGEGPLTTLTREEMEEVERCLMGVVGMIR
ncbi:type II toxin-antitoxin system PemK/MazF family toxin [Endothiovibrio diazotrophicus]